MAEPLWLTYLSPPEGKLRRFIRNGGTNRQLLERVSFRLFRILSSFLNVPAINLHPAFRIMFDQDGIFTLALIGCSTAEIFLPLARRVNRLAAVTGDALPHGAQYGGVDRYSRNDHLALGQCWQFIEQSPPCAFDRGSNRLLIDRVDDAHNKLRHALREHILIELSGPLRDQTDTDSEFTPL
jgi:hypothetical protein